MKKFIGRVVAAKMNKTVVVTVTRVKIHPLYHKRMKMKKKYHVHDELGVQVGNQVKFGETKPISKTKKWRILEVLKTK